MIEIMLQHAPSDWPKKRLGQLFRERREKVSDKDFPPLSVTMKGILPQLETAAKTDDGDNRKGVRAGDFVINSRSDRKGSGGLADRDGSVSLISIVLQPRDVEPRFAHHLLRSPAFQEEFYRWGHGIVADLWTTRYSDMKNILLAVPDRSTQKAIAYFLDRETARIDQLIEKKQRLMGLLREKRNAVVSEEFEDLDKEGIKSWRLRHLLLESLKYGANESADSDVPDGIRFIRITDLTADGGLRDDTIKQLPIEKASPYMLRDGDILLARSGATVGKSFIYKSDFGPCCFAGYLIRARLRLSLIVPEYFKRLTESNQYWDFISLSNIQATIQNVSAERYANLTVPLPSISKQKEVLQKIDAVERPLRLAIQKIDISMARLHEFRSALITAAVTGQIDVTTWGKQGQTDRRLDEIEEAMQA